MAPLLALAPLAAAAALLAPASAFSAPSWDQLRSDPALSKPPRPIFHDALPDDAPSSMPILYRDADCVCAASESVWLAMECKNVEYLTVLVSKEADDAVPRIVWPDDERNGGDVETDPVKLLEQIQARYPDHTPHFYPKLSLAVDASRCQIMRLPGVMPRYSEPEFMDMAPYIFRDDGTMVKKSSHCVSLEEVEEMQEEYYLGPYLCGRDVTAADMVWAPYLERYAVQLPLIFPKFKTCNPRSNVYDEVNAWYVAMERLPAYACCVQGDARHWRKCLEKVIPLHNERATSEEEKVSSLPPIPEKIGWWMRKNAKGEELWKQFSTDKPWLADTPAREVALYLLRNRKKLQADAASRMGVTADETDEALRELSQVLLDWKMNECNPIEGLSDNARQMALFLSEKIEVPRDVGMVPALELGELAQSLQ